MRSIGLSGVRSCVGVCVCARRDSPLMHRFEHAFHGLNGVKYSDLSYSQHGYGFLVFRREVSRTGQHMVMYVRPTGAVSRHAYCTPSWCQVDWLP